MNHTDPRASNAAADVGHESDDVDLRTLVTFTVGMFAVVAAVAALMWLLMGFFQSRAAKNDPPQSPLATPPVQMPTSTVGNPVFGRAEGVQLVTSEPAVLQKKRESDTRALTTYGWADEKNRVARIPIAEAKKLLVERGIPARTEPADPSLGTRRGAYGESSSGRLVTAKATPEPATPEGTKQETTPAVGPGHEKGHGQ